MGCDIELNFGDNVTLAVFNDDNTNDPTFVDSNFNCERKGDW